MSFQQLVILYQVEADNKLKQALEQAAQTVKQKLESS